MAGGVPDGDEHGQHEQREDDPVLPDLGGRDLQRARHQVELVPADRPEQRAAAMGQFVAGDVRGAAEGDAERQQRHVPVAERDQRQVPPRVAGDHRRADTEQVAVVSADVQRAERGGVQQRQQQCGWDQVPGERRMPVQVRRPLVGGRGERPDGEHGDAEEAVRAVPVAAGQPVHQPGEGLAQETELPRDRAVRVVDVRQHARPRGDDDARHQVRSCHVQRRSERRESQRAAQRVIPAKHRRITPWKAPNGRLR
jgi:hypothetical protein